MSTKRPDVLVSPPCDMAALTLAEILVKKWRLQGKCDARGCNLVLKVNVASLIAVYGAHKCWWGVTTICPREGCDGHISYTAQAIAGGSKVSMAAGPSEIAVQRWKNERGDFGWKGPR